MALAFVKVGPDVRAWAGIDRGLDDLEWRLDVDGYDAAAAVVSAYRALVMATPKQRNRVCSALRRAARKAARNAPL